MDTMHLEPVKVSRQFWLLLLALAAALWGQSGSPLVGRWHSVVTSRGGLGAIIEFHSDGVVEMSPGAVVPGPYRIENGHLIMPSGTADGSEQGRAMEWAGSDSLRLGTTLGIVLTRVGARQDQANPILGEWREIREMGGAKLNATWIFYGDGKMLLLIPFVVQRGTYKVTGGSVSMLMEGAPASGPFSVKGDILTLPGAAGSGVSEFRRY